MTFDEWYEKNKEALTQATTETAYRKVWNAAKEDAAKNVLRVDEGFAKRCFFDFKEKK